MSKKKTKKLKVNLGCGTHIMEGDEWLNIDNYILAGVKNFKQGDARKIPLESETVDYILCDQVLEHIRMADVPSVLFEIRRVLKPGGRAIIIVPDFRDAAEQWLKVDHNQNYEPMVYNYLSEVIYGNQHHEGEFHKTPMSAGYLNYVLNAVGLVNHTLIIHPALTAVPAYEGVRPYPTTAVCRNAQLVADITK